MLFKPDVLIIAYVVLPETNQDIIGYCFDAKMHKQKTAKKLSSDYATVVK